MSRLPTIRIHLFLAMAILAMYSCNLYKYVPEGDKLYTKTDIKVKEGKEKKAILEDLQKLTKPKPNASFFGVKYKLILFNMFKPPKNPKGVAYMIKNKWGEPPALLSQADPKASAQRMEDYYFGLGHFRPTATYKVNDSGRNASVTYMIERKVGYTIGEVYLPTDSSSISAEIRSSFDSSILEKGSTFTLNKLSAERERIDGYLKTKGYFFFNPEFILFRVDSTKHGVTDLYLTIKEETPPMALKTWRIGDIRVYGNYRMERDSAIRAQEGKIGQRFTYIDGKETYKTQVFEKAVTLREGQLYDKDNHSLTIERLMNLNNFRFVKLQFAPAGDSMRNLLHTSVFVTPQTKRSLHFEVSGNTKSNNFIGTEVGITYKNINLFRGAEILEVKLNAGIDLQSGGSAASNAYVLNATANLFLPKLYVPSFIRIRTKKSAFIPRTVISPGIEYNRTPSLYTLRSIHGAFGYYWKYGQSTEHNLKVLNLSLIQPSRTTEAFDSILATDPGLKASTERQLVIGMRYEYSYNNTYKAYKRFNHAVYTYVSTSGNLANLLIKPQGDTVGSRMIGGVPVTQYFKLQGDFRGYYKLNRKATLAGRFLLGGAFAYGNSSAVPFFEQFVTGGTISIRAFRLRTLGPGSYRTPSSWYSAAESGEFKLEMSSELRYKMSKMFNLAAFLDAGNIWLWKDAVDKPGSGLGKGDLFREMAVGTGFGIRLDVTIMVLRLDLGIPLRKPWYPEGQRWVFNEMDFGSKAWRKENMILNIAIGYPF
jgi:outer membrane protein insertion porin family